LSCGAPFKRHGEFVIQGHGVIELVLAREYVAPRAQRIRRVSGGVGMTPLSPVYFSLSALLPIFVTVFYQGLPLLKASSPLSRMLYQIGS
jgi:hypothetical protein